MQACGRRSRIAIPHHTATAQQQRLLDTQLEERRWLYNPLLAERRAAWEQRQESLRLYDPQAALPARKAERPTLTGVMRRSCRTLWRGLI